MRVCRSFPLLIAQAVLSGGLSDPGSSKVAFVKGTEVFSVGIDGANLKKLTADGRYKWLLRWSADGGRIAYMSKSPGALAQFNLIDASGAGLAAFLIRPSGSKVRGMRFVEELEWLGGTRVVLRGSLNPWSCEQVVLDTETGKEVEWQFGTCRTFVRSPDGKSVACWGAEGMGYSKDERREVLELNGVIIYPQNTGKNTLQFLSSPAWSSDSRLVALVDRDVQTSVTSLTVIDTKRAVGPQIRLFDDMVKPAEVVMHAPITFESDDRMEVYWVGNRFVVSPEGGAPLYSADPAQRSVGPAGESAREAIAATRAEAAQAQQTIHDLMGKLGGKDADVWTGAPSAAFTMAIRPLQAAVKPGDDVLVRVDIKNISAQLIKVFRSRYDDGRPYKIVVLGDDGTPPPLTKYGRAVLKNQGYGSVIIGGGGHKPVEPGATFYDDLLISRIFDLTVPGKYTVQFERADDAGTVVKSNTITITVTE